MRGETATFDIDVMVSMWYGGKGRRITARHIRQLEKLASIKSGKFKVEYAVGKASAKDYANPQTGEVPYRANNMALSLEADCQPVASWPQAVRNAVHQMNWTTVPICPRPYSHQPFSTGEIYRMMRPGEPPTRCRPNSCSTTCSSPKTAMICRPLVRMKFNSSSASL